MESRCSSKLLAMGETPARMEGQLARPLSNPGQGAFEIPQTQLNHVAPTFSDSPQETKETVAGRDCKLCAPMEHVYPLFRDAGKTFYYQRHFLVPVIPFSCGIWAVKLC